MVWHLPQSAPWPHELDDEPHDEQLELVGVPEHELALQLAVMALHDDAHAENGSSHFDIASVPPLPPGVEPVWTTW